MVAVANRRHTLPMSPFSLCPCSGVMHAALHALASTVGFVSVGQSARQGRGSNCRELAVPVCKLAAALCLSRAWSFYDRGTWGPRTAVLGQSEWIQSLNTGVVDVLINDYIRSVEDGCFREGGTSGAALAD